MNTVFSQILQKLKKTPIYSAHEHIGSLISFGEAHDIWFPSDVIPDHYPEKTTLLTLLFTPYAAPILFTHGAVFPPASAQENHEEFLAAMDALRPILSRTASMGVFVALDKGLKELYGIGLYDALDDQSNKKLLKLNTTITDAYAQYFNWFKNIMEKTGRKKF